MTTRHPDGLRTLFFTEMWERFSFYGMRAILSLFMLAPIAAGGMGLPKDQAGPIYAIYTSCVYLFSIPGGWIADNILGQRKSVLYGGFVIMIGHILLALHGTATFYAGLGCVVIGTGLLKPNISAIVGGLYGKDEHERREAGFSIFYMGINIGAFLAPLVCGWLAQSATWQHTLEEWGMDPRNSWHWGFGAAAVGMALGLVQYVLTGRRMGSAGEHPAPPRDAADAAGRRMKLRVGAVAALVLVAAVAILAKVRPELMTKPNITAAYRWILIAVVAGFFAYLLFGGTWTRGERRRLIVIAILFSGSAIFWGVFEQAGSTLTIFADESTHNAMFGLPFPSSWWQSVQPALIVLLAPLFSAVWLRLAARNPSYPAKFGIGLVFAGMGFLVLVGGAGRWTGIWDDYLAKNKGGIVTLAKQYDVELPANPEAIRVGHVDDIIATAKKRVETDLWAALERKDWAAINAAAAKYGFKIDDAATPSVSDVSGAIKAGKEWCGSALLPKWDRVSWIWLFLVYVLHTIGELCLSPVGLAAMTGLAPRRVVGLMMGVWFLSISVGEFLGGSVASYYDKLELPTLLTAVAVSAFAMALVMFAMVIPIKRMLAVAAAEGGTGAAAH